METPTGITTSARGLFIPLLLAILFSAAGNEADIHIIEESQGGSSMCPGIRECFSESSNTKSTPPLSHRLVTVRVLSLYLDAPAVRSRGSISKISVGI